MGWKEIVVGKPWITANLAVLISAPVGWDKGKIAGVGKIMNQGKDKDIIYQLLSQANQVWLREK